MEYVARRSPVVGSSSAFGSGDKKAQERILDLCERLGATHYINAVGGRGLYDRRAFLEHSVELAFLTPRFTAYQQGQAEFTPGLSIIDVLMFNSPERVNAMLDNYELD